MNLRSSFAWVRVAGLLSVLGLTGLTACDSDGKKAAPVKDEAEVKAEAAVKAAEPAKTEPVKTEPVVAEVKPADPVVDPVVAEVKPDEAKPDEVKPDEAEPADPKTVAKPEPKKVVEKTPSINGKPLYDAKCKVCHGADGKGTAAMKKNDIPDMADKSWQGKHSKAGVVKAITNGVDGTKMKSFKDKFKPDEIDAIAAYVKKLK